MSNAPKQDEPFDPDTVPVKPAATVLLVPLLWSYRPREYLQPEASGTGG